MSPDKVVHHENAIEAFGRIAALIVAEAPQDEVLQVIVAVTRELVDCDLAAITVLHRDGDLITLTADGHEAQLYRGRRFPRELSNTARVIETGKPLVIRNVSRDSVIASRTPGQPLGPTMLLPLVLDGPYGALSASRMVGGQPFSDAEVSLVRTLATQASLVLEQDCRRRTKVERQRVGEHLRLAGDLQESAVEEIFSASFELSAVVKELDDPAARERVVQAIDSLDDAVKLIRQVTAGGVRAEASGRALRTSARATGET